MHTAESGTDAIDPTIGYPTLASIEHENVTSSSGMKAKNTGEWEFTSVILVWLPMHPRKSKPGTLSTPYTPYLNHFLVVMHVGTNVLLTVS